MAENTTEAEPAVSWAADSVSVIEVVGEPAIVINGVPALSPMTVKSPSDLPKTTEEDSVKDGSIPKEENVKGLAVKGRMVRKKFGRRIYLGEVTGFDPSTNWYTVLYEDGDTEDLEWEELEEVLLQPGANPASRRRSYALLDTSMKLRERKSRENQGL